MTKNEAANRLRTLAEGFDKFAREGAETDVPEGSRFTKVSDTLLNMMSDELKDIADLIEGKGTLK